MFPDFSSPENNRALRERLAHIQRQSGFNQQQLANYLHIGQSAVSKYLNGRIPPSDVLYKFARLGQTTMEWILCGEKSYFYGAEQTVNDPGEGYATGDTDLGLARRIARLPASRKRLIMELTAMLED